MPVWSDSPTQGPCPPSRVAQKDRLPVPLMEREEVRVFEHLCPEASSWALAVDSSLSRRDWLEGQRPERTEAREGSAARVGGPRTSQLPAP